MGPIIRPSFLRRVAHFSVSSAFPIIRGFESIRNLAISRGGNLPEDQIELMLAHMHRVHSIMEQDEQEKQEAAPLPELDDISFEELKDSKTHHAEHAGKAGLRRLDL
ncbi:hypothetical protein OAP41_04375 [Candidatus Poseidoniaceae archaeon]|nr:hypothetical protein [Candidatus Poseidoniaceae archaeon]